MNKYEYWVMDRCEVYDHIQGIERALDKAEDRAREAEDHIAQLEATIADLEGGRV